MNEMIVTLMAFGLTVSQVFTKPVDQVRTQFNPQTDQAYVTQSLRDGCQFMLKTFKTEKLNAEPMFIRMIENARLEREEARKAAEAPPTPAAPDPAQIVDEDATKPSAPAGPVRPVTVPAAPAAAPEPEDFLGQQLKQVDPEVLLSLYKAYCKGENVDTSAVKLDQVIQRYNEILKDLPDVKFLKGLKLPEASLVLDRDGQPFTEIYGNGNRRKHVTLAEIPEFVRQLFISSEDKDFYTHSGLAPAGVARALMTSLMSKGRPQGGSTITQQVVKNLVLNDEYSIERKMREMVLALRVEKILTKPEILELYLNMIYLGRSSWGVEMAAQSYFKKSVKDLTLPEAALLAGITPGPNKFNPERNSEAAKKQRQRALFRYSEDLKETPKALSEEQFKAASFTPIKLADFVPPVRRGGYYFLDVINREARDQHKLDLTKRTYVIRSTIHAAMQKVSDKTLQDSLYEYERASGRSDRWGGPRGSIAEEMGRGGKPWAKLLEEKGETFDGQWPLAVVLETGANAKVGLPGGKEMPLRGPLSNVRRGERDPFLDRLKRYDLIFVDVDKEMAQLKITPVVVGSIKRDMKSADSNWLEAMQKTRGHFFDVPWTLAVVLDEKTKRVGLADGRSVTLRGPESLLRALQQFDLVFVHNPQQNSASLKIPPAVQGAIVVMENKTGRVLSMSGGFSYGDSKYNRAFTAARQPGSTLKPFIHLAALNAEFQPNTLIPDVPPYLPKLCGDWDPKNYDGGTRGLVTMRHTIEQSLNLPTVRIMAELGPTPVHGLDYIRALVQELGIYKSTERCYPFVLGAQPARVIDMAVAYATVANSPLADKKYAELKPIPRFFDVISENGREVVPQPRYNRQVTPSIDSIAFYQLRRILEGTVERGTAAKIQDLAGYVAGKTGTSNDENDAWFVGFTNDITIAVWVGYDSRNIRQNLGDRFTGGRLALPIAEKVLRASFELYHRPEPLLGASPFLKSQTGEFPIDLETGTFNQGRFMETFRRDKDGRSVINSHQQILRGDETRMGYAGLRRQEEERVPFWGQDYGQPPPGYYPPRPPNGYYQPGYDDQDMYRRQQRRYEQYPNPYQPRPRAPNWVPWSQPQWGGN